MPKSTRIAVFVVGLTLAAPAWASAQQAVPRNGGSSSSSSSGSSSSGSSSSGSSSSGSSSSGTTSSGSSSSSSRSNDSPPPPPPPPSRTAPPGSTYVGSAATRSSSSSSTPTPSRTGSGGSGAVSGSAVSRSGSDNSRVSGGAAASSAFNYNSPSTPSVVNPVNGRDRAGRPALGTATARPDIPVGAGAYTVFSPFGQWIPFYGPGFGYNLGFTTYNPWYYGSTRWIYGRYGLWYDPFAFYPYDPFYYPGYYGGSSYYGYSSSSNSYEKESAPPKSVVGAIRIKSNESSAKVYVDGVLMGSVSDFDGLSHHLELEAGGHQLELRADGFQTLTKDINVESGKTTTERLTLKKK